MAGMTSKWLLGTALSAVAMLAATSIPSEAHLGRPPLLRLQQELGLTDDQVRAIHQAQEQQWDARRQLAKSLGEARRSLRELVLKGADEAAIQAKTTEIQGLVGQGVQLRVKALQALSQVLTPEQREKILQLRPGSRRGGAALGLGPEPAQDSRLAVYGQIWL